MSIVLRFVCGSRVCRALLLGIFVEPEPEPEPETEDRAKDGKEEEEEEEEKLEEEEDEEDPGTPLRPLARLAAPRPQDLQNTLVTPPSDDAMRVQPEYEPDTRKMSRFRAIAQLVQASSTW